jgi:GT2 family glycosyltransferase
MEWEYFAPKEIFERDLSESVAYADIRLKELETSRLDSTQRASIFRNLSSPIFNSLVTRLRKRIYLFNTMKLLAKKMPFFLRVHVLKLYQDYLGLNKMQGRNFFFSDDLGMGIHTSKQPIVSIIIPVHNSWYENTLPCLMAIKNCKDKTPFEIIVIDDASSDMTWEKLSNIRGVARIRTLQNVGFLRANNIASAYAAGKYILLLNNDTVPISGWLDSLVKTIVEDPAYVIVGSKLLYPTGIQQEAGGIVFSDANAWNLGRFESPWLPQYLSRREVDYCSAASILIKRSFWEEVGGFDEQFSPAYYEDTDLAMTAWNLGYKVIYEPNSWVIHKEGASNGTSLNSGIKKYQIKNRHKFQTKWKSQLTYHWAEEIPRLEYKRDSKGIIVLIDRQLPAGTRDSGSVRTILLCKSIRDLGFHVVLGALDSSTSMYDVKTLRNLGVEVHESIDTLFTSLKERVTRIRGYWLIREFVISQLLESIENINTDAIFIGDLLDLDYRLDTKGKIEISSTQVNIAKQVDKCVLVSEYELDILRENTGLNNLVSLWKYFVPKPLDKFNEQEGILFVGGFRHLPNISGLEWFTNNVVPRLMKLGVKEPIYAVGSGLNQDEAKFFESMGVTLLGEVEDLQTLYDRTKLVVVPLIEGRGKKGKLAEALSNGCAVITTTVGAESFNLVNGVDAIISDSPDVWASEIVNIIKDDYYRKNLESNALKYASLNLSEASFLETLSKILNSH